MNESQSRVVASSAVDLATSRENRNEVKLLFIALAAVTLTLVCSSAPAKLGSA